MLLMLVNGVLFIITITTIYRSPAYTQMFLDILCCLYKNRHHPIAKYIIRY